MLRGKGSKTVIDFFPSFCVPVLIGSGLNSEL